MNYAPAAKGEKFVEALKRDYWKNVPKPAGDVRFNYRTTRFRYNQLKDWKLSRNRKPLIMYGARQAAPVLLPLI